MRLHAIRIADRFRGRTSRTSVLFFCVVQSIGIEIIPAGIWRVLVEGQSLIAGGSAPGQFLFCRRARRNTNGKTWGGGFPWTAQQRSVSPDSAKVAARRWKSSTRGCRRKPGGKLLVFRRASWDGAGDMVDKLGTYIWLWLKIKELGQTAGFGPCFHLPGFYFGIPVF